MRILLIPLAVLLTACVSQAGHERSDRTVIAGASAEQVRASAIEVLKESGLRVRIDSAEIVGSTGDRILPRGASSFVTCATELPARAAGLGFRGPSGYGVTGNFRVRVDPAEGGAELSVNADFERPQCPSTLKREPRQLCAAISCESTGVLERRIVEHLGTESTAYHAVPFTSLTRAVSAGTTSNRSPTIP